MGLSESNKLLVIDFLIVMFKQYIYVQYFIWEQFKQFSNTWFCL